MTSHMSHLPGNEWIFEQMKGNAEANDRLLAFQAEAVACLKLFHRSIVQVSEGVGQTGRCMSMS